MGSLRVDTTERLHFHALEKEMATHPNVLAWRIPGTGEPGGLPSIGSHKHDWSNLAAAAAAVHKGGLHFSFNVPLLFVPKHCFLESGLILKQKCLHIYRYICDLLHLPLTYIVYDTLSLINHILRLSQTCVSKVLSLPSSSVLSSSQTLLFLWGLTYRNIDMYATTTSCKDCFMLFI